MTRLVTRLYRATVDAEDPADAADPDGDLYRDHDTFVAWGETLEEARSEALARVPSDWSAWVPEIDHHDAAPCCECPRGHRLHDADLLAVADGDLYCVEHGMHESVGFEWDAYPALRWTCRGCGGECDARYAEDHGGLCAACAADAEREDRLAHEDAHRAGVL